MSKRMLIDATHEEETRVAIVDGTRLVEFDYESKFRKPLKGSIFLAKVTRVEPSLQAAFVNFGGNRHGFLPFSEIHPDYFRIPIADREALIAEQEEMAREEAEEEDEDEEEDADGKSADGGGAAEAGTVDIIEEDKSVEEVGGEAEGNKKESEPSDADGNQKTPEELSAQAEDEAEEEAGGEQPGQQSGAQGEERSEENNGGRYRGRRGRRGGRGRRANHRARRTERTGDELGSDRRLQYRMRRQYKIQEVIKRGQIMLIQVSKEERGNKGAAVSTYLSLPGRYCVLMPNSPRAGGVSRKIANYKDRAKMKEILDELSIPQGMSVIVRTAGVSRTKAEVKRDLDYLMRLWDTIREDTLKSTAPAMIYEEADLIKRAIRDLYTRDVEDIYVSGEEGYKTARSFMKMMIPSHVKKVNLYKDEKIPLFHRYQVEGQISEIGETRVTLKSGGYLVINPTEALVSIDVNSGKATKERHIEETALKTNLEAADELARQLRLRDLGGLVVIDFIDMEDRRNNAKVERRLKEALSTDRARIQVGRISSFGLLELSRQRLNPSLTEAQFETCPHCKGSGVIRTADATSIMVLRAIEEEGIRGRAAHIIAHVSNKVALYLMNNKRNHLAETEKRYGFTVQVRVDESLGESEYRVEVAKSAEEGTGEEEEAEGAAVPVVAQKQPEGEEQAGEQKAGSRRSGRRRGRRGGRRRGGRRNHEGQERQQGREGEQNLPQVAEEAEFGGPDPVESDFRTQKQELPQAAPANLPPANDRPVETEKAAKPLREPAPYEVVNKEPEKKKKGWWNKLVE